MLLVKLSAVVTYVAAAFVAWVAPDPVLRRAALPEHLSQTAVPIETRLLHELGPDDADWAAAAYVWLPDGSDAVLAPEGRSAANGTTLIEAGWFSHQVAPQPLELSTRMEGGSLFRPRMPPLGSNTPDAGALDTIRAWIQRLPLRR